MSCNQFVIKNGQIQPRQKDYNTPNYRYIPYDHTITVQPSQYQKSTILTLQNQIQNYHKDYDALVAVFWQFIGKLHNCTYESKINLKGKTVQQIKNIIQSFSLLKTNNCLSKRYKAEIRSITNRKYFNDESHSDCTYDIESRAGVQISQFSLIEENLKQKENVQTEQISIENSELQINRSDSSDFANLLNKALLEQKALYNLLQQYKSGHDEDIEQLQQHYQQKLKKAEQKIQQLQKQIKNYQINKQFFSKYL